MSGPAQQANVNEVPLQPSPAQVHSNETRAKDASSSSSSPVYSSAVATENNTLKDRASTISSNATETATAVGANIAQQANIVAVNVAAQVNTISSSAADRVNGTMYDTAKTAKMKILANPTVQDTTEQLRQNLAPDSHEIANKDYGIQGAIQTGHGPTASSVRDIGWHRPVIEIPDPLIGGLPNGRLFSLIRRFNKDVFSVRAVPLEIARGLDLNEVWSDQYPTDKITLNLQRFYLSVVLGVASFGKHVSRLRSWKETRRTGTFCAVYFTAWAFDLLIPLILGTLIAAVSSNEARDTLFPPAPLALVNIATGGIQKPPAGQLGTSNTLTGAPEKQEGEAVEEEAANFVNNVRHLVGKAIGMHESQHREGDPLEGKVPKPVRNAAKAVKAAGSAPGHTSEDKDQTQRPMEEMIWEKANPKQIEPIIKTAPHLVGEIVDNWERFANAISPTPPFHRLSFLRVDAVLAPAFLASLFVNYYMVYKATGFAIGFGIFGDPILKPSLHWLNRNYPGWIALVEPKNNILRGVPTNNQLTLTLLRIGEINHTPIPPVPTSKPDDSDRKQIIDVDEVPLDATESEIISAIDPSRGMKESELPQDKHEEAPKHPRLSKVMRVFKGNTKATVETKLAIDHVRAKTGSDKAKGHLGVLPKKKNLIYAGPSEYKARFDGKKGWIYLTESSVLFSTKDQGNKSDPVLEIPLKDIKQLKRATAFANKPAEMAADWGTEKELLASLEIDDQEGKTWRFTALPERDELFNRLIAIGQQRWESL